MKVSSIHFVLTGKTDYKDLAPVFPDILKMFLEAIDQMPEEEELLAVRQEILNTEKGSVLDKWNRFDCSDNLTRSDLEYLERTSMPEIMTGSTIRGTSWSSRMSATVSTISAL